MERKIELKKVYAKKSIFKDLIKKLLKIRHIIEEHLNDDEVVIEGSYQEFHEKKKLINFTNKLTSNTN